MTLAFLRSPSARMPLLLGLTAALVSACAAEKPPAPLATLQPAPIPPAAPAPPPVALSSQVVERAGEFRTYMRAASGIGPTFANGRAIEESLSRGASYDAQQLSRDAIAFAAVVALQEPGFVANVRTYAVDPDQRRSLAQKLEADPYYATALPGAPAAAGMIIASLNAEGARLRGTGELVKQSAYDVQHQAWSKAPVTDPAGRLAHAKEVSVAPMAAEAHDVDEMKKAVTGSDDASTQRAVAVQAAASAPPFSHVVIHGLAVAAVAALGEGGDEHDAAVEPLLDDGGDGQCLKMSKLNLYQCLAVAKPWYEDIFCLGQHVLIDTGQCITKAAGQPQPMAAPDASTTAPAPAPAASSPAGDARR